MLFNTQDVQLRKAACPWLCPQIRTCLSSQDDLLLRSFQEILNKITLQNFQVLSSKVLWLEFNTERRLTACIEKLLESVSNNVRSAQKESHIILYCNGVSSNDTTFIFVVKTFYVCNMKFVISMYFYTITRTVRLYKIV